MLTTLRRIERQLSTPDTLIDSLEGFDESDRAAIESARLRWRRGDATGAIASLDSVSAKYQEFLVSLFIVRGAARLKSGDAVTASVEFRRAIAVDSTSARAHLNLAATLARSSPKDALRELDQALRLQPDYVPALVTRGSVLIMLGRPHDAIPDLERATQLQPSGSAWEVLATARGIAGDMEGMKRTWEEARTHNPQSARAWFNVAITHYNEGSISTAVAFADSALARAPDSPDLPAQISAFRAHALAR